MDNYSTMLSFVVELAQDCSLHWKERKKIIKA